MKNSNETVTINSTVPNASVSLTAHFKTTKTAYAGTTDGAGRASITFKISTATSGYQVQVDLLIGGAVACRTSFTTP